MKRCFTALAAILVVGRAEQQRDFVGRHPHNIWFGVPSSTRRGQWQWNPLACSNFVALRHYLSCVLHVDRTNLPFMCSGELISNLVLDHAFSFDVA